MSWIVNVVGNNIADAKAQLAAVFTGQATASTSAGPLAERGGLSDEGERETVKQVAAVIDQCLGTFDPAKPVLVSAGGNLGRDVKGGAFQTVTLSIQPK